MYFYGRNDFKMFSCFKYMWRNVAHVTTQKVLCYALYIKQIHLKQMSS